MLLLILIAVLVLGSREAGAQANWQEPWDKVVAAAKKEGVVVVTGPPFAQTRQELEQAFGKRFGFKLEYVGVEGAEAVTRVEREAVAGRPTIDAMLGGNTELLNLFPAGRLAPIKDKLILPEVLDPKKWRDGRLKFNDPQGQSFLQTIEFIPADIVVNTSIVKPQSITSWKDLLKPEYQEKIATYDPRGAGQGTAVAAYVLELFGPETVKQLYLGQKITYTRDRRQLADWVSRGTYPIALGVTPPELIQARQLGLPVERVFPKDGPGGLSGSNGVVKLVKNSPHPNAAIVFANWFPGKEAQEIFQRTSNQLSRRTDVGMVGVADYFLPKEGVQYSDKYSYEYTVEYLPKARKILGDLLGR
jgi:iron(III) transport system substrate-binding protein